MPHINIPHFDLPFKLAPDHGGTLTAAVVEQDSIFDIANSVEVILRVHEGWREEVPEFGSPDFAFLRVPFGDEVVRDTVMAQEPRAELLIEEHVGVWDNLINTIIVKIFPRGGEAG